MLSILCVDGGKETSKLPWAIRLSLTEFFIWLLIISSFVPGEIGLAWKRQWKVGGFED